MYVSTIHELAEHWPRRVLPIRVCHEAALRNVVFWEWQNKEHSQRFAKHPGFVNLEISHDVLLTWAAQNCRMSHAIISFTCRPNDFVDRNARLSSLVNMPPSKLVPTGQRLSNGKPSTSPSLLHRRLPPPQPLPMPGTHHAQPRLHRTETINNMHRS